MLIVSLVVQGTHLVASDLNNIFQEKSTKIMIELDCNYDGDDDRENHDISQSLVRKANQVKNYTRYRTIMKNRYIRTNEFMNEMIENKK